MMFCSDMFVKRTAPGRVVSTPPYERLEFDGFNRSSLSVFGGSFGLVDNNHLYRAFRRVQLQTELLPHFSEE